LSRAEQDVRIELDAQLIWQAVLTDLRRVVPAAALEWLRQTRLSGLDGDTVTIDVADRVTAETLSRRFAKEIERALSDRLGRPVTAVFQPEINKESLQGSSHRGRPDGDRTDIERQPARRGSRARSASAMATTVDEAPLQIPLAPIRGHGLNPRYVFDTYVVGSANRFAHAASVSVAERPGGKYNPLFIHGGVGLGKTHLLHAIGHRALDLHADLQVSYVTSEKFTNDLIAAIRQQRTDEFRARYREIDILMIDDIQFIAGKESTQEEFFHTFNSLYQSGKQVIISSDKPPKAISALEERLRSRFEGGLIADVQLPDYEMRTAILRMKAEELDAPLPDDVAEYIAHKDQSNIRELEGALNKVMARAHLAGAAVTLTLAIEALGDGPAAMRRGVVTKDDVVSAVLQHFAIGRRELIGRTRTKEVVLPRQVAMYLLREETGSSLLEIGAELGGRDHTTVLHGIRQVERSLQNDPTLRAQVLAIRESIITRPAT
jgi:chromosomal replication initiator protein